MNQQKLHTAFCAFLLLAGSGVAHAFTDFYDITSERPPGLYEFDGTRSFGNWSVTLSTPSGSVVSTFNTGNANSAPPSVVLRSLVSAPQSGPLQSLGELSIIIPEAGTLSFSLIAGFQTSNSTLVTAAYTLNSVNGTGFTGSNFGTQSFNDDYVLPVEPGDILSFQARVDVGQVANGFDQRFGIVTLTISDFTFTPTPIPEPSSFAVFAGLAALTCGGLRRRSRA